MMKHSLTLSLALFLALSAPMAQGATRAEQIRATFNEMNQASKGALGPNQYQGVRGRTDVMIGGAIVDPPADTIFTAAFRSAKAATLADLDFYVGSRFSTDYWELHSKFVAQPYEQQTQGFVMDHARFMTVDSMAGQARSMARHMIMEQFYMRLFPNSRIAKANNQRGTADAENEARFFGLFSEYLARQVNSPQDYLALFELERRFNLSGDANTVSLQKVRDRVAMIYDRLEKSSKTDSTTVEFRSIRNAIHNYMTPDVVEALNKYIRTYQGSLRSSDLNDIANLRDVIVLYYRTDKRTLVNAANALGSAMPASTSVVLQALSDSGNSLLQLESLGRLLIEVRNSFAQTRNPALLLWIVRANTFIQSELAQLKPTPNEDWTLRARIALDSVFASGLIPITQWQNVRRTLESAALGDVNYIKSRIDDFGALFISAHKLTKEAMSPALEDWAQLEGSLEGVLDDTLRSSALTELDRLSLALKAKVSGAASVRYSIENAGEAYGYLTYVSKSDGPAKIASLTYQSVAIFEELPLDLGVVAAIVTEQPQTPLSHVSIKSKARGTPDLYLANASRDPLFRDLLAKRALVYVKFSPAGITVREASLNEAQAYWNTLKPPAKVDIRSDLNDSRIRSTRDLYTTDIVTVGAKAANYGEASKILPDGVVREGLAVPFYYYRQFIETNMFDANTTLAQAMRNLVTDSSLKNNRQALVDRITAIQNRMTSADMVVNPQLLQDLERKTQALLPGSSFRFRSSTNSEDLPNFSGAGLYDSFTYEPNNKKKTIASALKRTWASVWNLRAFDERERFGIPHFDVHMGILVVPSYSNELANGVAVTRNLIDPSLGSAFYINTQIGEELVTNPNPTVTPEELLVLLKPNPSTGAPLTLRYVKYSSLQPNAPLMTNEEALKLADYLGRIHQHFKKIVDPLNKNPKFSMDVEFKVSNEITGQRQIFIKQARPYVGE